MFKYPPNEQIYLISTSLFNWSDETQGIKCIECSSDTNIERCENPTQVLEKTCGAVVTKCYLFVKDRDVFSRGCATIEDPTYKICEANFMDNCIVCYFDNCNSDPLIEDLTLLECQKCDNAQCDPPMYFPCYDYQNTVTRPTGCYWEYRSNGKLQEAGCLTETNLKQSNADRYMINCFGSHCVNMDLNNRFMCGGTNCSLNEQSEFLGCYGLINNRNTILYLV